MTHRIQQKWRKVILLALHLANVNVRRKWYHLVSFQLFSMCPAADMYVNCTFLLHLYLRFYYQLMIYSLRYGDMTILKIAAVCRLEFSKYNIFLSCNLCHHHSASSCKISLKSDIRLLSYGQKTFQHGGHAPSWIWFNLILGSRICPIVQSLLLYIEIHQNTKLFSLNIWQY